MESSSLPGVKIGPLDPDATAEFGRVDAGNNARILIRRHTRQMPAELRGALLRAYNGPRSKALQIEEVRAAAADAKDARGNAVLPEGAKVVGANVRGHEGDEDKVVTLTYQLPAPPEGSGRTGKAFIPYDGIDESIAEGDRRARIAELREQGYSGSSDVVELIHQLVGGKPPEDREPGEYETSADDDPLAERVVELEKQLEQARAQTASPAEQSEPFEGYSDANVEDIRGVVEDEQDVVEREFLKRRIRAAEQEREQPRKGVLEATEPVELAPVADGSDGSGSTS